MPISILQSPIKANTKNMKEQETDQNFNSTKSDYSLQLAEVVALGFHFNSTKSD